MTKKRKRFLARMQYKLLVVVMIFIAAFVALVARILYINPKDGKRY